MTSTSAILKQISRTNPQAIPDFVTQILQMLRHQKSSYTALVLNSSDDILIEEMRKISYFALSFYFVLYFKTL